MQETHISVLHPSIMFLSLHEKQLWMANVCWLFFLLALQNTNLSTIYSFISYLFVPRTYIFIFLMYSKQHIIVFFLILLNACLYLVYCLIVVFYQQTAFIYLKIGIFSLILICDFTTNQQNIHRKKDEFYPQLERHLQPIAAACERCKQQSLYSNAMSWDAPGLQSWGNPPRLPALQQRSFRGPVHPSGDYY